MKEQVNVQLTAHANVAYGEDLVICGSVQPFGCWSVAEAAPMTWQEGCRWSVQVSLPSGVLVEFKVVVKQQGGGVRWLGAGPGQESNIVLETKLGRGGALGSRLVGEASLPFDLEVVDIEDEVPHRASPFAHTMKEANANATPALSNDGAPPPASVAMLPYAGAPAPVQVPAQNLQCHGAPPVANLGVPAAASLPPHQQEAAVAAMVAGSAAGAGHTVTYTTTTTTTVTINGADPMASAQATPRHGGPYGQLLDDAEDAHRGPSGGGQPRPASTGQHEGCAGSGTRSSADARRAEATPEQREAFLAARMENEGLARLGPVALCWPRAEGGKEPSSVSVRGSWDGWARDLAMEPAPGGGWRLLLVLPPGSYELKFIVDGNWTTSDDLDRTQCVNKNNIVFASDMALAPTISPLALSAPETPHESTNPSVALVAVGGC
mmetsp:Transcript_46848/g.123761  ORF Transcript_46848/g.123761 Transcript_46848/m.123761 type:complete len:436 (-) Transcript_46848:395-1702(-)